jgi:hypothetical protein
MEVLCFVDRLQYSLPYSVPSRFAPTLKSGQQNKRMIGMPDSPGS